jgi:hypothetical protein
MFTTSYFASKAPKERKVCIALKRPRFFHKGGLVVKELAPTDPWATAWQAAYLADLNARFPSGAGLLELLNDIATTVPNPVLCCYEKEPSECHRHILAKFVFDHLGIRIKEWA